MACTKVIFSFYVLYSYVSIFCSPHKTIRFFPPFYFFCNFPFHFFPLFYFLLRTVIHSYIYPHIFPFSLHEPSSSAESYFCKLRYSIYWELHMNFIKSYEFPFFFFFWHSLNIAHVSFNEPKIEFLK